MTPDEATIILLKDALEQAQHTVQFLHGCLTSPGYKYAYPEQTLNHLKDWAVLAPCREGCYHSYTSLDCDACKARKERFRRLTEARTVLGVE